MFPPRLPNFKLVVEARKVGRVLRSNLQPQLTPGKGEFYVIRPSRVVPFVFSE